MDLMTWQDQISDWYENRKHDQVETLEVIVYQVPKAVFGPQLTDEQSRAIACWLDGGLRVFQHARHQDPHKAFQTLQYISAKLEQAACDSMTDILIKDWCLKRLQHITVLSLEFCNQQNEQTLWGTNATSLIDTHVKLMDFLGWNERNKMQREYQS
jgi:hypothetical protein